MYTVALSVFDGPGVRMRPHDGAQHSWAPGGTLEYFYIFSVET